MRIGMASTDWSPRKGLDGLPTLGGSGHYRIGLPSRYLASLPGTTVAVGRRLRQKQTGEIVLMDFHNEEHGDLDLIVIQRWMEEHGPEAIRRARAYGQVIVSDLDDWMEGLDPSNLAFQAMHPRRTNTNSANAGRKNINHFRKVLGASSALTVSTPYLKERYRERYPDKPIFVLRNMIDLDRWPLVDVDDSPVVGWVGSTTHRSRDLESIANWMQQFFRRHPDVIFHHSGVVKDYPLAPQLLGLARDVPLTFFPQTNIEQYPTLFAGLNIGIVPLSDQPFNYAKSAIKGMEYSACGIPFVASATPEYRWLHDEHGLGLVTVKPRMWLSHLERLLDPDERLRMGTEARQQVAALDVERCGHIWWSTYTGLLEKAPH